MNHATYESPATRSAEDLRFLASLIAGTGPLALHDLEAALGAGLSVALDAVETSVARAQTAERVFQDDGAARAEFGRVDLLEGHLIQLAGQARGIARRHVEPMSADELLALCRRTRHEVDGTTSPVPPVEAARPGTALETPQEPASSGVRGQAPTLDSLARRLGFVHGAPAGGFWEMLEQRGVRLLTVDGERQFGIGRLSSLLADDEDRPTKRDKAAAHQLANDLRSYLAEHEPEALRT
ncbi:MAG: hypothetical protein JNL08_05805 [Planctomycetes bacterium]|nr:hypothetical protein [Planctomycetota bacterium]